MAQAETHKADTEKSEKATKATKAKGKVAFDIPYPCLRSGSKHPSPPRKSRGVRLKGLGLEA